jgi:nucleoside-diphosphate-sugar epimerase
MKNILVLGSSGQIGMALVDYLRLKKYNVTEFDISQDSKEDLRERHILDELLKKTDFVFFLSFDVGGSLYLKKYQNTKEFMDNNMKMMLYTFESLDRFKTPFVFASSQMANMDYSNYGLLKSIGEKYTEILQGLLVKFWNVYGLEKDENKFHVITDFIKAAKKDGHISMRTSGLEERQFLHATDCSECLEILMNEYNSIDRKANLHITSFKWNTIIDISNIICSRYGSTMSAGDDIDIQKNKKNEPDPFILTLWKPKISLEEGIDMIYHQL